MNPTNWRIGVTAVLAGIVLAWLAAASDRWTHAFSFTGQQPDYYNLLVDGFLEGHLHLKAEVHPGRLSPDIEVRKQSPYLLDAAQYGNHYYLYYGVVPAVTVLLPYAAITGHDLSLNAATLGFVLLGFLVSVVWYRGIRRDHFPATTTTVDLAVVLLLAFGPATTFLVRRAMFYELPLAAGYAFLCGFIWSVTQGLGHPARGARWIMLASLCVGLAAGCHPNYTLLSPLVALAAWWIYRGLPPALDGPGAVRRLALAAVLPAALIGTALAWYNHARFGNPLEFGFNYGVNGFFETKDPLLSPAFLWPNFKWYYLTPPTLLPYFPFVFPAAATFRPPGYHGAEAIHGQFLIFLLMAWIGGGTLLRYRTMIWPAVVHRLIFILGYAFAIAAIFILLLGIRANRYMVDFQLPLVALGVLLAASLGQFHGRDRLLRLWRGGLFGLALLMTANNVLAAIQQFDNFRYTRPAAFAFLTRTLNPSWTFWGKLGLVRTGTLAFDVTFPLAAQRTYEPLLTVGVPGYSDSVYAVQHSGNLLELAIDHFGHGGPRSRILSYEPGRTYALQIELGGFHPPETDPYFAHSPEGLVRYIKTKARVVFDGEAVIDDSIPLYDAAPWQREFGSNLTTHTAFSRRFSGRISNVRWLPSPSPDELIATQARSSILHLMAVFPNEMPANSQPLVGFGRPGQGTLLFLQPTGPGQWNLAVDEWGFASPPAAPITLPPGRHTFDLFVGPRAADDPLATQAGLAEALLSHHRELRVWLDGKPVGKFALSHHLDAFAQATPGANPQGFSTSEATFYSEISMHPLGRSRQEEILRQVVSPP